MIINRTTVQHAAAPAPQTTVAAIAVATILHDLGSHDLETPAQLIQMSAFITPAMEQIGFEGALGELTPGQVNTAIIGMVMYPTASAEHLAPLVTPTLAEAQEAIHLVGIPGGFDTFLFG